MKELIDGGIGQLLITHYMRQTLGSYSKSSYEQVINNLSAQWNISKLFNCLKAHLLTRQFSNSENFLDPNSMKNDPILSNTNLSAGTLATGSGDSFVLDWQASLAYNRFIGKQ